jgi:mannose-6-phosphate isomerase-like protein (cupin superfamily)
VALTVSLAVDRPVTHRALANSPEIKEVPVTGDDDAHVIRNDELPRGENSSVFHGHDHGAGVCFFLSHNRPNTGPKLHRHPYEETFIVQEGDVLFTVGESTIDAGPGDVVVVPAGAPHKFLSRGATHRQISIHPVARMETEWLE